MDKRLHIKPVETDMKGYAMILRMAEKNRGRAWAIQFFLHDVMKQPEQFYDEFIEQHPGESPQAL